jgi:hypothetical protein
MRIGCDRRRFLVIVDPTLVKVFTIERRVCGVGAGWEPTPIITAPRSPRSQERRHRVRMAIA